jgi:hypothetical protein
MDKYESLVNELDKIIGFLEVSDLSVFQLIKDHDRFKSGFTIGSLYNNAYSEYQNHICMSALLLGFSFLENFLFEIATEVVDRNPELNKGKFTLEFIRQNYNNLNNATSKEYVKKLRFTEALQLLKRQYGPAFTGFHDDISLVNDIRNCIMHNSGLADNRLQNRYDIGKKITLSAEVVNNLGLSAREFAQKLWCEHCKPITISSL